MKIELTEQICKIIDTCGRESPMCEFYCPLFGACLERLTGDDSENKEVVKNEN